MRLLLNCIKDDGHQGSSKNYEAGDGLAEEDVVDHVGVLCSKFTGAFPRGRSLRTTTHRKYSVLAKSEN